MTTGSSVLSVTTGSSVKEVARSSVPVWRLSCGLIAHLPLHFQR